MRLQCRSLQCRSCHHSGSRELENLSCACDSELQSACDRGHRFPTLWCSRYRKGVSYVIVLALRFDPVYVYDALICVGYVVAHLPSFGRLCRCQRLSIVLVTIVGVSPFCLCECSTNVVVSVYVQCHCHRYWRMLWLNANSYKQQRQRQGPGREAGHGRG